MLGGFIKSKEHRFTSFHFKRPTIRFNLGNIVNNFIKNRRRFTSQPMRRKRSDLDRNRRRLYGHFIRCVAPVLHFIFSHATFLENLHRFNNFLATPSFSGREVVQRDLHTFFQTSRPITRSGVFKTFWNKI